ncbi:MAG: AMP-binding protein [Nocardioides sp.]
MSVAQALVAYRKRRGPAVLDTIRAAAGRVPALDARLREAGLAGGVDDVDALDRLPVLSKDALPALQRENPPLGGLLAADADVVRLFASPGPIYEPQLAGPDPWNWAPALTACGIGSGDVVLNCFSHHLSPAGAMFDEACRAIGAVVVPGGVGNLEVQAQVVAGLEVTAFIGLPSYLAALVEKYDAAGLPEDGWRLCKALVTAEPLPDPLRAQLRTRVATVLMAYGTAEAGLIGYETEPGGGLAIPRDTFVEVCDPTTGHPTGAGEPGEVVVSVLHADFPLVRFGTGDVSRWGLGPDGDPRLAGVLGRVGAAVKVRGMFVHPHQAREVLVGLAGAGVVGGRFVVGRDGNRDVLTLQVVLEGGSDPDRVVETATGLTRETLRVRPEVEIVDSLSEDAALLSDGRDWS